MNDADIYTRAMFGQNAIQVPFNCIVQANPNENTVAAVIVVGGSSQTLRYMFGGKKTHQLIIGDAIIRPHLVMDSDHLTGTGIAGIARSGFADVEGWMRNGTTLIDAGIRNEIAKRR